MVPSLYTRNGALPIRGAALDSKAGTARNTWKVRDGMQFLNRTKEAGFTFKESEVLRRLAGQCGFIDPAVVLSNQDRLDMCIRLLINEIKMSGKEDDRETQGFLSRLYDFRQKMEMDGHVNKNAISNTLQIKNGQVLKILLADTGVFKSQIVKNAGGYMTISRPVSGENVSVKEWRGKKLSVYFWRDDDAGYTFDTEVTDEVYSLGILSLKISHNLSLSRVQKRKSVRAKMNVPAFLYLVGEGEPFHRIETAPGLKCMLEDLSDTGCAVTVGGKAAEGLHVKIQFQLKDAAVCVSGIVRSTIYRANTDRSVLHIEFDPLPTDIRNKILGKVLGTLDSGVEDDLPFRDLDSEAANTAYRNLTCEQLVLDSLKGETAAGGDETSEC